MTIDIKYENYSVKDFLEDDLFLQWQLAPTETLDEFWKQVLQQYPHQEANLSDAVRTLHSVTINHVSLSRREEDKMLQNIYARYRRHRVRRFIYWSTSVAASLILLFLLVSPLRDFTGEKVNVMLTDVQSVRLDTIQDVQLIIGEKKTIAMAEDADISWTKEDEIEVNGRSSNSTYKSRIDADVTYSTLLVPYGKRSFLTLRDGTKVWINSGTEVRFPVNMEGKERSIYVDGEIYIEVAKDKERPFYVHTSGFDVRVYGTKFNVTSYKADKEKSVVLVDNGIDVQDVDIARLQEVLKTDPLSDGSVPEILVDNDDKSCVELNGVWNFNFDTYRGYGLNFLVDDSKGDTLKTVKYIPDVQVVGEYEVYMFFPRLESAATYTSVGVYDGKNMEEKQIYKDDVEVVGQTGGEWVYVGKYTLAKGRDAYVEISNKGADNVVAADAVLFRPVKK